MYSNTSNTSKVMKGMSSQTIVTIVLGLVEIISFSIMSRLLSPQDFGYYAAISAILMVFNSFAETGIGSAIIQRKQLTQEFINNAFTLSLIFGIIISATLFLLSDILADAVVDHTMSTPLRLMSLTLLCYCMTSPYLSMLYRKMKFLTVGFINLTSLVITSIIAIVLASKGYGYYSIIAKAVTSSILTLFFAIILSKTRFTFSWNLPIIKSIWNYSGWLMGSVVFRNLASQCDRLLMSRLFNVELLGNYNRPKEFINQISSKISGIFDTALFPVLSGIQDNMKSLQRAFAKSLYLMNLCSLMMTIGFVYNAELIIRIFFGEKWLGIVVLFQILSILIIFDFDGRLADCYLRSLALTKSQFFFRIAETTLKFIGVVIGAYFGLVWVAVGVVLSSFIMVVIKLMYIAMRIKMHGKSALAMMIKAWQPLLLFCPILTVAMLVIPHDLLGCMLILLLFFMLSLISFVIYPSMIGSQYRDSIYPKVKEFVSSKFTKLTRQANNL